MSNLILKTHRNTYCNTESNTISQFLCVFHITSYSGKLKQNNSWKFGCRALTLRKSPYIRRVQPITALTLYTPSETNHCAHPIYVDCNQSLRSPYIRRVQPITALILYTSSATNHCAHPIYVECNQSLRSPYIRRVQPITALQNTRLCLVARNVYGGENVQIYRNDLFAFIIISEKF